MKFRDSIFKTSMIMSLSLVIGLSASSVAAKSIYLSNSGFESGVQKWTVEGSTSSSSTRKSGDFSVKMRKENARVSKKIKVLPNTNYELSAYIRTNGELGVELGDQVLTGERPESPGWSLTTVRFNSGSNEVVVIYGAFKSEPGYFDEFEFKTISGEKIENKAKVAKLDASLPPSGNFDLTDWKLSIPTDVDGNDKSDTISETELSNGYTNERFFYTKPNGGMAFNVPVSGYKTSKNTKFTRVELREMLRQGDEQHLTKGVGKNNWVLSTAPAEDQAAAGAVNGTLTGTLSVDHVTTTGDPKQVGRVVFAQIHAEKDEPIRFYYRKLPNNTKGSIYFAHEPLGKKDVYTDVIGSRSSKQEDPEDGIALGEKFSYSIKAFGNGITVKLYRPGKKTITKTINMSLSGYDQAGQYMYFKAGAYLQDSTGNPDDYAEVVYYALDNQH